MITTRTATEQDAATVGALVGALLSELRGAPAASQTELPTEQVKRFLGMKDRVFGFLAHEAERPVGAIMLSEGAALYAGGIFGVITELYIVPDRRSHGVAKELIKAAAALGKSRGWRQLEVGAPSQPTWKRSYQFYLKSGFSEIGPRLKFDLTGI